MISVTEEAKSKLQQLQNEDAQKGLEYLRVSVLGGGCSGLKYDLKFDNQISDKDEVVEENGLKILVDKKSVLYLLGTTLDYSGGLNGKGFEFVNPNASRTCSCGESFAV